MKEDKDSCDKVEKIIALENKTQDPGDKSYILGIKYIFTKEFSQSNISWPSDAKRKKNKDGFNYLRNFINILDILFLKKNETERKKLYNSKISSEILGNDLFNSVQNLQNITKRKLKDYKFSGIKEFVEVNEIYSKYIEIRKKTLLNILNMSFYYLGLFITSIDTLKFQLFYFFQLDNKLFEKFEFKDYCPDLKSPNCLTLILLFFESSINNDPIEILYIYGLLIFRFKQILGDKYEPLDKSILRESAKQTLNVIKEKTLNNTIIIQYVFLEFINNLNNNLSISLIKDYPKGKEDEEKEETNEKETKKKEIKNQEIKSQVIENIEIKGEENKNKAEKNKNKENEVEKREIQKEKIEENKDKERESENRRNKEEKTTNNQLNNNIEEDQNKNTIEEIALEKEKEIICKMENSQALNDNQNSNENDIITSQPNITLQSTSNLGNNSKVENEKQSIIEQKSIIENNKSIDNKENNNNTIDSKSRHFSYKINAKNDENTNKVEDIKIYSNKDTKELEITEQYKSSKTEDIIKIMENINQRVNVVESKNDERYNKLMKEYYKVNEKLNSLQKKYQEISELLGYVQMREGAKNILNPYEYLLDQTDRLRIEKENMGKWKLIANKIKEFYGEYKDTKNYKVFIEIVEKCVKTLSEGNEGAHHIKIEFYEKEIEEITKEFNNLFIEPIKICFLIKIKVSKNLLKDGYELLDKFFENDMTRKIIRSYSLENYFNESK